jgi:hypothetical protein
MPTQLTLRFDQVPVISTIQGPYHTNRSLLGPDYAHRRNGVALQIRCGSDGEAGGIILGPL